MTKPYYKELPMEAKQLFIKDIEKEITNNEDELLKDLESCRILTSGDFSSPEIAWEVRTDESDNYTTIGTKGNFTLVKGKAKSKKSFFINLLISKALGGALLNNKIRYPQKNENSVVLYFDTEQSKHHVQQAVRRVSTHFNGEEPKNFRAYGLRAENVEKRLRLIDHCIMVTPNVSFVVIDGIKDLVTSVNDERESSMIASKLLEWTEKYNLHVIVVLHENPSSDKARGHLGTELVNKAETTIAIECDKRNKAISIVSPYSCRNMSFEPFAFEIDKNGIPQVIDDYKTSKKVSKKKVNLLDMSDEEKIEILKVVFKGKSELGYNQVVKGIQTEVQQMNIQGKGEKKIKELITNSREQNWLLQPSKGQPYKLGFSSGLGHSAGDNISPCTSAPLHR